jgi:uncharacterized protein
MTNFIPIFPLNIVAYPTEKLNLHIFEPRYLQMIEDCLKDKKPFGIVVIQGNRIMQYGTLIETLSIEKKYDDGRMDIKTKGIEIFKILEIIAAVPSKLYSGAIVSYVENSQSTSATLQRKVVTQLYQFLNDLGVEKNYKKENSQLLSYDFAHHLGLSLSQEFEVLSLFDETQRLEYLSRHIST